MSNNSKAKVRWNFVGFSNVGNYRNITDQPKCLIFRHKHPSDTRRLQCVDVNNPLQTVFKRVHTDSFNTWYYFTTRNGTITSINYSFNLL